MAEPVVHVSDLTKVFRVPEREAGLAAAARSLFRRRWREVRAVDAISFAIGPEDAVYLRGQLGVRHVDEAELDRILGSLFEYSERFFHPAMRIGYASRFIGRSE